MKLLPKLAIILPLLLANPAESQVDDIVDRICVQKVCTQIEIFKSKTLSKAPVLVLALHGDAPSSRPSYHYDFARSIALTSENVVAVGILRPGYTDDTNRKSDGVRGDTVGDNYDNARVLQIASVIEVLKKAYKPSKVVLAGHSGGAVITAKLIALKPGLVNTAFVISCPCNINAWRSDMYKYNQYAGFKGDLNIVSPINLVNKVRGDTRVSIFVGRSDTITRPYLSEQYYKALSKAGKQAKLFYVDGDHEIFQSKPVLQAVLKEVDRYNKH